MGSSRIRLLFFIGALRDAGTERVTVVVPYLCYARKDRRSKPRDPVTTRYVAALFEAVGTSRIAVLDVHNAAAFQSAFRIPGEHLEARPLFVRHLAPLLDERPCRCSRRTRAAPTRGCPAPLAGGLLEARRPLGFAEKQRSEGEVTGELIVGEVRDRVVVMADDLISTGTTMVRAARACRQRGAAAVYALATHVLFMEGAPSLFQEGALDRLIVTNSVPAFRVPEERRARLDVLDVAPFLGEAIRRMHEGGSLVDLMEG